MTDRRGSVFKWVAYTAAFLFVYFFSAGIFPSFPIAGAVPAMIPVAVAITAVLEGSFAGSVFGICLGLLGCVTQSGIGASLILCCALIGAVAGAAAQRRFRSLLPVCLLASFGGMLFYELVQIFLGCLLKWGSLGVLIRIGFFELLYSMLLAAPAYFVFRFVYRRFGSGQ